MQTTADAAGASDARMALPPAGTPPMSLLQLPTELVVKILEYLPQADLQQVASVSRSLYRAAWSSGRCIHQTVAIHHPNDDIELQLGQLNEVIEYVLQRSLRLWLSISIFPVEDANNGSQSLPPSFLSAITRSLPRLVGLSFRFGGECLPDVYSALRDPAPLLRTFKIFSDPFVWPDSPPLPPLDIFAAVAPQLHTLGLRGNMIGTHPVPAFAQIRTLLVEEMKGHRATPLHQLFPHLSTIQMYLTTFETAVTPMDVSGLELRTLVLRGSRPWERFYVLQGLRLDDPVEVHLVGHFAVWSGPLWERDIGAYAVHVRESARMRGWQISVIPAQRPYRFVYHVVQTIEVRSIDQMPLAAQHLTSLRMDNTGIHGFLKSYFVSLLALREICIDLHSESRAPCLLWPPDYPHLYPQDRLQAVHRSGTTFQGVSDSFYYYLRCPALEKVTVFALDRPMTVLAPEIAFFGRSLSLLDVPDSNKPTLSLFGVDFAEWTESQAVLLGRVFSSVAKLAFVGASLDDYDHIHCVSAPGDHLAF